MGTDAEPIQGSWYCDLDKDEEFFVIDVYEDDGIVEIQYYDGDVQEIELDSWYDLNIEAIEVPEDWVGPYDDVDEEDLGYEE